MLRAIAELWLEPGRGERVMLPPLLRGARLTFGLWPGIPFERTAGLLLRATLPLWLRLTCGTRLRLTCALRFTWGALWLRLTRGALWLRLTWGARLRLTCALRLIWEAP